MRLKNLSINISSNTFSPDEKVFLESLNDKIDKLCKVFDVIVQMEAYVVEEIKDELAELLQARSLRDEMIKAGEKEKYIRELFLPAVKTLSDKIAEAIEYWDTHQETTSNEIREFISTLKKASDAIKTSQKFQSLNIIQDLINEFGYFKVTKSIFTDNVVERVTILIDLKDQITNITSDDGETIEKHKRKKVSIDDL